MLVTALSLETVLLPLRKFRTIESFQLEPHWQIEQNLELSIPALFVKHRQRDFLFYTKIIGVEAIEDAGALFNQY